MGLEADAREDGGHVVVVPEGLLHKGLQELKIGDAPELNVLLDLRFADLASKGLLVLRV
jgi:hypothetical protein